MGANKKDMERMKYVYFSYPMTDEEHHAFRTANDNILEDWNRDYDDFNTLFADDPMDKKLRDVAKKAKKERDDYRDIKRKLVNGNISS